MVDECKDNSMISFPNKKYNIIYADPPWGYDDQSFRGTMANHYKCMNLEDIKRLPIKEIAEVDCILFLWATYPKLREAFEVIDAWNFHYKTIAFQWIKKNKTGDGYFFGLGRWTRSNTECCLLSTKGRPKRVSNSVSQLVFSRLRNHSQKPDEVRHRIVELMGDLPRIELFARDRVEGWDVWGNEIPKTYQKLIL